MRAIILVGGKGERLNPLTNNCPKGMIKIVTNGDIYTEMDLRRAIKVHLGKKGIKATICLFPYRSSYGIVESNHSYKSNEFWRSIETTKDLNEFSNHMGALLAGRIE